MAAGEAGQIRTSDGERRQLLAFASMSKLQTIGGLKWKWHRRAVAIFLWLAALIISLPSAKAADARAVLVGAFDHPLYVASAPGQSQLLFAVEQSGRVCHVVGFGRADCR
jgi:hypothetical protein